VTIVRSAELGGKEANKRDCIQRVGKAGLMFGRFPWTSDKVVFRQGIFRRNDDD
jgi:hypothetical protein